MRLRSSLSTTLRLLALAGIAVVALLAMPVSASASAAQSGHPATAASGTASPAHSSTAAPRAVAADCTLQVIGTNVNVRTGPGTNFPSVGQINASSRFRSPGCAFVVGQTVTACGFTENLWDEIIFNGATRFVTDDCMIIVG